MINNKVVMITGGGGLIGSGIAKKILENNSKVILIDKSKKSLLKFQKYSKDKNILIIKSDLSKISQIDLCIKKSIKHFGKIDTLIHAAYPKSKGWGTKFENLKKNNLYLDLNNQLGLAILISQKILRLFKSQGFGNLVFLSSIQGVNAPKFEHYKNTSIVSPIEYSAIKAGIIAITKYLSKYFKKSNIRVNSISPGGILDNQPKNFLKNYKKSCNDKGLLDVNDLVGTVLFLTSDHSRYINGQNIIVDDGWTL